MYAHSAEKLRKILSLSHIFSYTTVMVSALVLSYSISLEGLNLKISDNYTGFVSALALSVALLLLCRLPILEVA